MGQRQTDSGTVEFTDVEVAREDVLATPGPGAPPRVTLRACLYLLVRTAEMFTANAAARLDAAWAEGDAVTAARFGIDRFWRNARTHTLHDPIDYKICDLGEYALRGEHPKPSLYG